MLPKWKLHPLDEGGKNKIPSPPWLISLPHDSPTMHREILTSEIYFFCCCRAGMWSLPWSNSSLHYEPKYSSFHQLIHTFITLQITHLSSKRDIKGKNRKGWVSLAQKVLGERGLFSLWLAVIWIKVHSEVVNDLNSKTCYYNWSKNGLKKSCFIKLSL